MSSSCSTAGIGTSVGVAATTLLSCIFVVARLCSVRQNVCNNTYVGGSAVAMNTQHGFKRMRMLRVRSADTRKQTLYAQHNTVSGELSD
jgi:hypothetical protein